MILGDEILLQLLRTFLKCIYYVVMHVIMSNIKIAVKTFWIFFILSYDNSYDNLYNKQIYDWSDSAYFICKWSCDGCDQSNLTIAKYYLSFTRQGHTANIYIFKSCLFHLSWRWKQYE